MARARASHDRTDTMLSCHCSTFMPVPAMSSRRFIVSTSCAFQAGIQNISQYMTFIIVIWTSTYRSRISRTGRVTASRISIIALDCLIALNASCISANNSHRFIKYVVSLATEQQHNAYMCSNYDTNLRKEADWVVGPISDRQAARQTGQT